MPRLHAIITGMGVIVTLSCFAGCRHGGKEPETMRLSGTVEVTTVDASFKFPGRVARVMVDEGDVVKVGQILALQESHDQAQEVEQKDAEARAARAFYTELKAGSRREEVARSEAALAAVTAESERLSAEYRRQENLFAKQVIARKELDLARAARDTFEARVREARENLALVKSGPRPESIEQAHARYQAVQAVLALAKNRLAATTLPSPRTGVVLAKKVESGEQVSAGTPVVSIGDLDDTWVRCYINEPDLARVKLGQDVRIISDSRPGRAYSGRISFIASDAEFTPKSIQTEKERVKLVFRIKVAVDNSTRELKPGMPVTVEMSRPAGSIPN